MTWLIIALACTVPMLAALPFFLIRHYRAILEEQRAELRQMRRQLLTLTLTGRNAARPALLPESTSQRPAVELVNNEDKTVFWRKKVLVTPPGQKPRAAIYSISEKNRLPLGHSA